MQRKIVVLCTALVLVAGSSLASAQPEPYFAGKTITLVVPFGPGGGTDVTARLVAAHLGNYMEGNPTVLVENRPGGGGAIGFNHVYTRARPDGLTLGVASTGVPTRWLLGAEGHDYNLDEMHVVAAFGGTTVAYVRTDVAKNVQDLLNLGRTLRSAHTDVGGTNATLDRLAADLLGYELRQVAGYGGYGEARLAVLRGETDMSMATAPQYLTELAPDREAGDVVGLFQIGLLRGTEVVADRRLPDVPLIADVYREIHGGNPEDHPAWIGLRALAAVLTLGQSFWLPPGTPPEVYDALVAAFERMSESEEYRQAAIQLLGAEDLATVGKDAQGAFEVFATMPDEAKEFLE